jgi:hypothetical protein
MKTIVANPNETFKDDRRLKDMMEREFSSIEKDMKFCVSDFAGQQSIIRNLQAPPAGESNGGVSVSDSDDAVELPDGTENVPKVNTPSPTEGVTETGAKNRSLIAKFAATMMLALLFF